MQRRGLIALFCLAPALAGAEDKPPIDHLKTLGAAIQRCWQAPRNIDHQDATIQFSLRANGTLFGEPTVTYAHAALKDEDKAAYTASLREAISRCAPFSLSERYGAAVAGHPIRIRFTVPRQSAQ